VADRRAPASLILLGISTVELRGIAQA